MASSILKNYLNMSRVAERIVENKLFKNVIIALIVATSVISGLETYPDIKQHYGTVLHYIDEGIFVVFVIEIILKVIAAGKSPIQYFKDGWNLFDFLIVMVSFMPDTDFFTVFRLFRILRVLRLITSLPKLQLLVDAFLKSIPSLGYVVLLLLLLFYVYASIGTILFRNNDPVRFGSLEKACLSLFTAVTLENWSNLMYTQLHGSNLYGYDNSDIQNVLKDENLVAKPEAQPIASVIYFLSFILIGGMVIINLFIAVIMNGIEEVKFENERQLRLAQTQESQEKNLLTSETLRLIETIEMLHKQVEVLHTRLEENERHKEIVEAQKKISIDAE